MQVKDIIDRVTLLYNDKDFVRCSKRQYLEFLDDAIAQTIVLRPDSHVQTAEVTLRPGTRQTIPVDGYSLIDIYANMQVDEDGVRSLGRPVFQVGRKDLDYYRNWHTDIAATKYISEFAYDIRNPKVFFVWPPIGEEEIIVQMEYSHEVGQYASMYDELQEEVLKEEIPLDSSYRIPLVMYMLYLLYSTDSTSNNDQQVAAKYEQSFMQSLSRDLVASSAVMPVIDDNKLQETGAMPYATSVGQ